MSNDPVVSVPGQLLDPRDRDGIIQAIEKDRQAFYERLFEKYAQLDSAQSGEDDIEGSFALSDDEDWDVGEFPCLSPIPIQNERFQEYVRTHAIYDEAQSVLNLGRGQPEDTPENLIVDFHGSDTEECSSDTDGDSPVQVQPSPCVDPLEEITPVLQSPRTPRARRKICPSFVDEIVLSPPAKAQQPVISSSKRAKAKSPIRNVKNTPDSVKNVSKQKSKKPDTRPSCGHDISLLTESMANTRVVSPSSVLPEAKSNQTTPKRSFLRSPQTPKRQTKPDLIEILEPDRETKPKQRAKAKSPRVKKSAKTVSPGPTRSSPRLKEKTLNSSALDETTSDIENACPSSDLSDISNRSFVFGRADSLSIIKKAQLNQMKSRSFVQEPPDSPKKRPQTNQSQTLAPSQHLNIVLGRPGSLAPLRSARDQQRSRDLGNRSLSVLDQMFDTPRRRTKSKSKLSLFQSHDSSLPTTPTFEDFQHPLLQSAKFGRLGTPRSRSGSSDKLHTRNSSMISTSTFLETGGGVCSTSSSVRRFRLSRKKKLTAKEVDF